MSSHDPSYRSSESTRDDEFSWPELQKFHISRFEFNHRPSSSGDVNCALASLSSKGQPGLGATEGNHAPRVAQQLQLQGQYACIKVTVTSCLHSAPCWPSCCLPWASQRRPVGWVAAKFGSFSSHRVCWLGIGPSGGLLRKDWWNFEFHNFRNRADNWLLLLN